MKAIVIVLVLMFGLTITAQAQDQVSAQQLLEQGLQLYEQGNYAESKAVLQRVDPLQLSKEQRVALFQTLEDVDRQDAPAEAGAPAVTTADILASAAEAQAAGENDRAVALYQDVLRSDDATQEQKAQATAALAQAKRSANAELSRAKALISEAEAALQANRYAEAAAKIQTVQDSGLDLGWFDNQRLARLQTVVSNYQAAELARQEAEQEAARQAAAEAEAAEPEAATDEPVVVAEEVEVVEPAPEPAKQPAPEVAKKPTPAANDVLSQAKRLYAQQSLALGQQAETEGNYRLAVRHYEQAAELDPENPLVQEALTRVQTKAIQQDLPRGVLEEQVFSINVRSAAAEAEFRELMNRANELAAARSYTAAQEAVQQAKIALDRNRRFFPAEQYQSLRNEAVSLAATIADQANAAQIANQAEIEQQRLQEAKARRIQALQEQQVEVERLLIKAVELRREQKYEQALELLNQALFLDPTNIPAQGLKEMIEDSRIYIHTRKIRREQNLLTAELHKENVEALLPYSELMTYPPDWPQLTAMRYGQLDQTSAEAEMNQRVATRLKEPVPINFEANRLVNVIDYLRNTTGLNFYVNWSKLRNEAGVEQDSLVTLQLTNVPADHALDLVLRQVAIDDINPIGFSIIKGIVTISTLRDLNRTTEFKTYDIRDLLVQVPNFEGSPSFSLGSSLSNTSSGSGSGTTGSGGGGGGGSLFGGGSGGDEDEDLLSSEEMTENISSLIRDTIGRQEEWDTYGGDVSSIRPLNDNLIIKTTPSNHREIIQLLAQLREARAMQISIEARFLVVDNHFLDEVGVDLDVQINDIGGNFTPVKIAQDTFGLTSGPISEAPGAFALAGTYVPGTLTAGSGFGTTNRSLTFGVGYMDDLQVNLLVRASQIANRGVTLTAPRVTFFNGQRAFVTVTTEKSFVSDLVPIPDALGFDPTLSIVQSGVSLDVEGTISADRRYVTMTVRPSLSRLADLVNVPITAAFPTTTSGGGSGEPLIITSFVQAPELELTTLSTTVSVPDKGTLMLGGQRLVSEVEVEAGVPILSKIPVLNRLFTNRTSQKDERTLLILIKPTIIIQNEQEDRLFPGLLESPGNFLPPSTP